MKLTNIKTRQKDSGFTIVELLVVIVVIGILAAITIISYTGITDRAKASQSASNASTVASVAEAYYADCAAYPSIAQLGTGVCGSITAVTKLPASITANNVYAGAQVLTTSNFTSNVIYALEGTTGACIANYDPTYTSATAPNFTNLKVTLLGTATYGFGNAGSTAYINPNTTASALCT